MRKILFLILAGGLILAGCGTKDGGGSPSIVGKWNVNQILVQEYLNNELKDSITTNAGSITFDNNGNITAVDEDGSITTSTYTYNSSSKLLTEIDGTDSVVFNVTKLTASNLHLYLDYTQPLGTSTTKTVVNEDFSR